MKSLSMKKALILVFLSFCLFAGWLLVKPVLSCPGPAGQIDGKVRLAIFWPQEFHFQVLKELREQGFLAIDDLEIIGIYHEKELTDFSPIEEFVKKNDVDWFKFREIKGELNAGNVFQKNGCTADFKDIFENSDGVIFFGGADIQPWIYGQKTGINTYIRTPYRHLLALSMVFHLLGGSQDGGYTGLLETRAIYPVLGICLGCQILNVGTGGTMVQDIWSDVYGKKYLEDAGSMPKELLHKNPFAQLYPEKIFSVRLMHPVKLAKDGKFCSELGFDPESRPYVLSAHHQMLGDLGKGMKVIAMSLDGKVAEAIEHEKYPHVLGVQFHPENPWLWDNAAELRFSPEDEEEKSLAAILEENPPSYAFHKKLWLWFGEKLKEARYSREHR